MDGFDFEAVFDVDDYLNFYGDSLTDQRTDSEVAALVSLLGLDTPRKILDLACGFGRHTNRLAVLGHTMTGVDITPGFLDLARKDAQQRQVAVQYIEGDMRTITFKDDFDYVLILYTSFGYFPDDENSVVLSNVCKALHPGGCLIFDTPNRDSLLKEIPPYLVMEKDGDLMIDRFNFDSIQGRLYNKRIVFRHGVRKDKPNFTRLYNPNELVLLLQQAGLSLLYLYGGFNGREYTSASRRIVVLAQKPSNPSD
jgi:SAM-dependent methyltransferase